MQWPTYADVLQAAQTVNRFFSPTPLYQWPGLSKVLGCNYYLKLENNTPTGAFKVRGGLYLVSRHEKEQKQKGIIACTTGNHGQSLAYASRIFGVRCVLVVPAKNNPDKIRAMRELGAEVIEHGQDYDAAREYCETMANGEGLRYVHSANEPDLIAGVATYAKEIYDILPDVDVMVVPVGLGSGICGAGLVARERCPTTRIVGVQSEGAPAVTLSWRTGKPISTPSINTFAEGMATRVPATLTLAMMRELVHEMTLVSDGDLRKALRLILEKTHQLAEGAGAAATAAALNLREQLAGKTVVGVLSGGNLDLRELPEILQTH